MPHILTDILIPLSETVAKDNLAKNIIADETIRLTGIKPKFGSWMPNLG